MHCDVDEAPIALVSAAEAVADARRYRAFFDAGLPITFMGVDYFDKAASTKPLTQLQLLELKGRPRARPVADCPWDMGATATGGPAGPGDFIADRMLRISSPSEHHPSQ